MCGIVGYVGSDKAEEKLIKFLKRLEYRGYDSSGIGVLSGNNIKITRAEGKIVNLEQKIKLSDNVTCGIGHTRWATHGKATERNAHPHISQSNEWAVVHNGIIENFGVIKTDLASKGVLFSSETDTEVIAQLLGVCKKTGIEALIDTCSKLTGSWALACINRNDKGTIYVARNKSPLYVCKTGKNCYLASDPSCFSDVADEYYMLEDFEFAKIGEGVIEFYNNQNEKISKRAIKFDANVKYNYNHNWDYFMIKEIHEIPEALKRVATTYNEGLPFYKLTKRMLNKINRIKIVGCGTAYHSGLVGATYIEKMIRIETTAHIASEFRYQDPIMDRHTLAMFVSQSGETADTLSALEKAKKKGAFTIAITNVSYSTIAKKADIVFPICAGPEIAVASTKAYVCQCAVFFAFAKYAKCILKNTKYLASKDIRKVANKIYIPTDDEIKEISDFVKTSTNMFFLGRDMDYYTAQEGCLKLKEITYINANAYAAGELKHGVLALVEENTPIVVIATEKRLLEKTLNGAHEAAARGGKVVLVSQFDVPKEKLNDVIGVIKLPNLPEELMPMISVVPLQKLAYKVCVEKGYSPDQPRNLAKSVTVE